MKAIFKVKDDELTLNKAIKVAMKSEDAAKVTKETVYEPKDEAQVHKIHSKSAKSIANRKDITCFFVVAKQDTTPLRKNF